MTTTNTAISIYNYILNNFGRVSKNCLITSLKANNIEYTSHRGYIEVEETKLPYDIK